MKTTWPVRISEDGSYALRDIVTTYGCMYEVVDANKIETTNQLFGRKLFVNINGAQ